MRKSVLSLILGLFCCVFANAQDFRTSYFLSNYLYDYRINPACMGNSYDGFVSVGVGDVTVGVQSSFPMNTVIFKDSGGYHLGVNKDFSEEKLSQIIPAFSKLNLVIDENIFAMGWNRGNTAGTLEVNLRSYTSGYFDYELIRMGYYGYDGIPYSMQNTKFNTRDWVEVAYGFSNSVSDRFSFGGRIKGLIGLNYSDLDVEVLSCDYGTGIDLKCDGVGSLKSSNTFLRFPVDNGLISPQPQFGRYTIGGFGVAADLGFLLRTDRDIEISVSALDIGGLLWHNKIYGVQNDLRYLDNLEDVYKFVEETPASGTSFVMNPVTVEAGVKYPINQYLSAGTLATIRVDNTARGWYEIRVGGSVSPAEVFSIAASAAMNTLGAGIGMAMNLRVPGVAFTVGTDSLFGLFSLNSDGIPARKLNTNLHAGLSVAW